MGLYESIISADLSGFSVGEMQSILRISGYCSVCIIEFTRCVMCGSMAGDSLLIMRTLIMSDPTLFLGMVFFIIVLIVPGN